MSTIQFGGVVSGLNTQGIIDALVAVKKQPLTDLQSREASLTSQKTAYAQLGTVLDDLAAKAKAFTVSSVGASRIATSADTTVFTATASSSTPASSYQVSVDRVATSTRATSTVALGASITGTVNTSLTLADANLAAPITTGNMAVTVDGQTVQFAVGDPSTTTLQSLMDGIASAVQSQIQAQGDTATVAASIVGGQLRLSVTGNAVAHSISLGDAVNDTSNAAVALGLSTQGVVGAQNPTITGTAYLDPALSSLNLPGSITAGQISAVVDGVIVHYAVGDPTKTTLTQVLKGLASALQTQLQSGGVNVGADATATVGTTLAGNRLQISVSGAGLAHSISFGGAGDASNALGILGIANASATGAMNPTLSGSTNLGVVRTGSSLDTAGLSGLTSTAMGVLTINGVAINYNSTVDSLATVISAINNSGAGVVASVDRTNDKLLLTRKDTGALAIDIADTSGNLGATLRLAPGTTNAQAIGLSAQVTVDGRTITSTTNTITNAIEGVTINAIKQSSLGVPQTLTVGVDSTAVATALTNLAKSYNSLADTLDSLTASTPGTPGGTAGSTGPLATDTTARTLLTSLRDTLFGPVGSGAYNSLGSIGLSTGAIGSAVGTTNRLQVDASALTAAMNADPNQVASLLDSATGPIGNLAAQLKGLEDPSNTGTYVQAHTAGLGLEISQLQREEADQQSMVTNYQATIEAQYAAMESTLAMLQAQSASITATLGQTSSSSSGSGLGSSSTSS